MTQATNYFVSPSGSNANNGLSTSNAFKTVAYACSQVPSGNHIIHLAPGTYEEIETAFLKSGVTLEGSGTVGSGTTVITNAASFAPVHSPCDFNYANYLIGVSDKDNFAIRDIAFQSRSGLMLDGAIDLKYSENFVIENIKVTSFRWAGIYMRECGYFELKNSTFINANNERHCNTWSGNFRTRYIWHSEIHHNTFISDVNSGYGYKASGHENVRFHHNTIDAIGEFAFESAHENEYGLEIDNNVMNRCISIPKSNGGANPASRGFTYAIDIHHNKLSDSYTIEGPRNYLIVRNNDINITKTGGRVYSHHGGTNTAWIKIHNNIVRNLDRSFAWANAGTAKNLKIFNNTIYCADAGSRTGAVLDFPSANSLEMSGWEFKNNVVIAPSSKPRSLHWNNTNASNVDVSNNLTINVTSAALGTISGIQPGFKLSGAKPYPYYSPAGNSSAVVGAGVDVGLPYVGAPDIGAYEYDPNIKPSLIKPMADAYVRGGSFSNTNLGSEALLTVKESGDSFYDRKSFMKFDLSNLGTDIQKATLNLHVAAIGGESVINRQIQLREVNNDSWLEDGITWSNQPSVGNIIATKIITGDDVGSTIVWDLKDFLLQEVSGDKVMSLALVQPSGVGAVVLFSSKEGMSAPELNITYNTVNLAPVADAYVRAGSFASDNFGNESVLVVKESEDSEFDRISYLKFNVSGSVGSAFLKLYVAAIGGENVNNRPIEFLKVTDDSWSEGAINWSNKPALGAAIITKTINASSVGTTISIDVTDFTVNEASGDGTVTIAMRQPTNTGALVNFSSKEGGNSPVLNIVSQANANYTVRARMLSGSSDQLDLRVDDVTVHSWTINSGSFSNYSFNAPFGDNVQLYFHDSGTDIEINHLTIDGTIYQAENQLVNTSVWQNNSCGGSYSQKMHCTGYIEFSDLNTQRAITSDNIAKEIDHDLQVYPIPSRGTVNVKLADDIAVSASVYTTTGQLVYLSTEKGSFEVNLKSGLYIMVLSGDEVNETVKLIIE